VLAETLANKSLASGKFLTDSGCSLIHPDPNEAEIRDFISSLEIEEILFRDLFTISDCNFINSGGLGIPSFPPQDPDPQFG
jgi:hypothetical protein